MSKRILINSLNKMINLRTKSLSYSQFYNMHSNILRRSFTQLNDNLMDSSQVFDKEISKIDNPYNSLEYFIRNVNKLQNTVAMIQYSILVKKFKKRI